MLCKMSNEESAETKYTVSSLKRITKTLKQQHDTLLKIKYRVQTLSAYIHDTQYKNSPIASNLKELYKLFPQRQDLSCIQDLEERLDKQIESKLSEASTLCTNFVQDENLKHIENEIEAILTQLGDLREANKPVSAEYIKLDNAKRQNTPYFQSTQFPGSEGYTTRLLVELQALGSDYD